MFRDDEEARASYVASLERTARRVELLEQRMREVEAENRQLAADNEELRKRLGVEPPVDPAAADIYIDAKVRDYAAALVRATDPGRTDGILTGAPSSDAQRLIDRSTQLARDNRRPYVVPGDVQRAARELLPPRIVLRDPDADPADLVRAILGVVGVP